MNDKMNERVERILAELNKQYELGDSFTDKVRPLVEKILDPSMPEEAREPLMKELIDVYESQARLRSNLELVHEFVHRSLSNELSEKVETANEEDRDNV